MSLRSEEPTICLSTFLLCALSALFAAGLSIIFFPGLMSFDSLYQYQQTLGLKPLDNNHPVVMVYLWKALHTLFPSPGSLLILHQFGYWAGAALFAWAAALGVAGRVGIFALVGFWPPLVIHSVHLWKDAGMVIALMLAVGALLADTRRPHWAWFPIAGITLFYAFAVRHNGFLAVFPVTLLFGWRLLARSEWGSAKRVGASLCIGIIVCLAFLGLSRALSTDAQPGYGVPSILLWDMAAVSIQENEDVYPLYVQRQGDGPFLENVRSAFRQEVNVPSLRVVGIGRSDTDRLFGDWLEMIVQYPTAYLSHRVNLFSILMGAGVEDVYYPFHPRVDRNELNIALRVLTPSHPWNWVSTFSAMSRLIIYRPWLYMVLGSAVLGFTVVRLAKRQSLTERQIAACLLAVSGVGSTLALFVVATAADYRYTLWLIASVLLALLLLLADLIERRWMHGN